LKIISVLILETVLYTVTWFLSGYAEMCVPHSAATMRDTVNDFIIVAMAGWRAQNMEMK
jgi:hypothetical protein